MQETEVMERRELLALFGAGAAGLVVGGPAKADDDQKDGKSREKHHAHMKVMGECAAICNMVSGHCLKAIEEGGGEQAAQHAKIACATNDCQDFCVLAVTLMARHSPMAAHAHHACADACRDCAAVCEKSQDEKIKKCAEICRECERLCREACEKKAA
jgi:hypothetical protein